MSILVTHQNEVKMYSISDKLLAVDMNIHTNINCFDCLDFTRNYNKNINIVIPSKIYSLLSPIKEIILFREKL